MTVTMVILYMLLGLCSGLIAGLFGVGGGMIIVPMLLWFFNLQGFDPSVTTHLAIGTSLAVIIVTSISSAHAHSRNYAVRWDIVKKMTLGLLVGALLGAQIAKWLNPHILQLLIGLFACWVGLLMCRTSHHAQYADLDVILPSRFSQISASLGIGTASSIFGIGGGSFTVPYLSKHGLTMQHAVGTSSAMGLPIACAGALGFMVFGAQVAHLPESAYGFVYLPAFLGIALTSVFSAKQGAKLANYLPANRLKRYFGVFLIFIGCLFLFKGISAFPFKG